MAKLVKRAPDGSTLKVVNVDVTRTIAEKFIDLLNEEPLTNEGGTWALEAESMPYPFVSGDEE